MCQNYPKEHPWFNWPQNTAQYGKLTKNENREGRGKTVLSAWLGKIHQWSTDASYLCHLVNCHFTSCLWRVCLFCSAVQWGLYMCRSWEQSKHLKKVIQCLLCDTILASTKDFVVFAVSRHLLNPLIRKVSRNNKRGKIPSIRKVYRISKRVKVPWIRKESKGFFRLSCF